MGTTVRHVVPEFGDFIEVYFGAFAIPEVVAEEFPIAGHDVGEMLDAVQFLIRLVHVHDSHGGFEHLPRSGEVARRQVAFDALSQPVVTHLGFEARLDLRVRGVQEVKQEVVGVGVDVRHARMVAARSRLSRIRSPPGAGAHLDATPRGAARRRRGRAARRARGRPGARRGAAAAPPGSRGTRPRARSAAR